LCAHQKHNGINNLLNSLPPFVPQKYRGTAGAQMRLMRDLITRCLPSTRANE